MPPARTIHVDTNTILANIAAIAAEQHAAVVAQRDAQPRYYYDGRFEREAAEAVWVSRDLELLAGKRLTASERIRHQQAMRKLEADGLVVLGTRHVMLTDAGTAAIGG